MIPLCAKVAIKHNIESNPELTEIDKTTGKIMYIKASTNLSNFYDDIDETKKSSDPRTKDGKFLRSIQNTR